MLQARNGNRVRPVPEFSVRKFLRSILISSTKALGDEDPVQEGAD